MVLSKTVQADGQQLVIETDAMTITISRKSAADLDNAVVSDGSSIKLPRADYHTLAQSFIMSVSMIVRS